ncbi:cora-domain-containing protein, partial [Metschnikowia bicuspidata var. bicuspidata NRRL YB-4993]
PLTGRNLQTLLEQSDPAFRSRGSAVALDMDPYDQAHGHGHDDVSLYSHDSRKLLLEFGELNPLLDHLSDLTSLDDVCFPDYYEGRREGGATENTMWPDLSVLEQYIVEEQEDLKEAMADVPAGVNFQYPVARQAPSIGDVYSENVLPSNEESPLLNSVHVDETELVRLTGLSLRVRPKAIQPWEKSREHVPTILNKKNPEAEYRFTYFREDIEGTLHAPTLSGLVATDQPHVPGEQILAKLHELFSPSSTVVSAGQGVDSEMPPSALGTASHSRDVSQRLDSPMPLVSEHPASASGNSALGEKHVAPFWLDVTNPLEEEMKVLAKTFGLHPLTTEDIFLGETREKVELFRLYYFICFTSFDIVYERRKQRAMEHEKKLTKLMEYDLDGSSITQRKNGLLKRVKRLFGDGSRSGRPSSKMSVGQSTISRNNRIRSGELCPLNMYMIIFETGVLTFHFNATPHPINVRRRARMLKDHLTVSTDWICYALIDDITDSFAPMIDSIEHEVYNMEDEIMRMHSGDLTDSDLEGEDSDDDRSYLERRPTKQSNDVFYRRQRSKSIVDAPQALQFLRSRGKRGSGAEFLSIGSARSTRTKSSASSSQSTLSKIVAWKRKGDMLRRIGECRKRVMSVMRLLGTKADVIKGFSKRFSENETISSPKGPLESKNNRLALKQEILMYLGDIQDHIVTMVQSLNHYEKLLARSHSNYLAQLNIDMTKVNNDTNDILGKVTILGTIVLPINVVTGLWGMNCIVPGQDYDGLMWFNGIVMAISMFSIICYIYAKKVTGL